jgi:hypothetical protein
MTGDIYESIDQMIDLCERKITLLQEMKRALRLAELVGIPAKGIKDRMSVSVRNADNRAVYPWQGYVLHVRIGDGPDQQHKLIDVHLDLWPADLRRQYETYKTRQKRRTENV